MPDFMYEHQHGQKVVGIDEAGRGPLAGPVVAAAVYFADENEDPSLYDMIDDSKRLSKKKRQWLYKEICRVSWIGIGCASPKEIDQLNIHHATLCAMQRAYRLLSKKVRADAALIDGKFAPLLPVKAYPIVKGDQKSLSIAAASIVAKTVRDQMMEKLARQYPYYGWENNAGYPTQSHRDAIQKYGVTKFHRESFEPIRGWYHNLNKVSA